METDKATFPLIIKVTRFDVAPPGQMAMSTRPTANRGSRLVIIAIKKAMMGNKTNWLINPTKIFLGSFVRLLRSSRLIDKPKPRVIIAKVAGKKIFVNKGVSMDRMAIKVNEYSHINLSCPGDLLT